jgi:flagellin-like protein
MKALRKGVSPVVATLLLILIAVAAAVLLYTWVSGMSANVAGSKVTGKTLTVIQATWAMGNAKSDAANPIDNTFFSADNPVLIISFKAPPAAVGGGGAGSNLLTIDNVDVIYSGRVICHYNAFALSAADVQHTATKVGAKIAKGLVFGGYVGSTNGVLDNKDLYPPGGIVVNDIGKTPANATGVGGGAVTTGAYAAGVDFALGKFNVSLVTIIAGVWQVQYVSTNKVETYFNPTTATIRFDRWTGDYIWSDDNTGVPLFDLGKVGQDDWSLIIYCTNVNPNVMNSVDVRLQFQDGSTWQTTVPLTVQ